MNASIIPILTPNSLNIFQIIVHISIPFASIFAKTKMFAKKDCLLGLPQLFLFTFFH